MARGRDLVKKLNDLPGIEVQEFDHGSNIFPVAFAPNVDQKGLAECLRRRDIFLYPDEGTETISRLTVNTTLLRQSNDTIVQAFIEALESA